jgi:hypothetical protein
MSASSRSAQMPPRLRQPYLVKTGIDLCVDWFHSSNSSTRRCAHRWYYPGSVDSADPNSGRRHDPDDASRWPPGIDVSRGRTTRRKRSADSRGGRVHRTAQQTIVPRRQPMA